MAANVRALRRQAYLRLLNFYLPLRKHPQTKQALFTSPVQAYVRLLTCALVGIHFRTYSFSGDELLVQLEPLLSSTLLAWEQVTHIFDVVGKLLADGRTYLVGDRFSAADLTFAALSVAVVRPSEYGDAALALSNLEQLPPKMAEEVCAFREMPAGAFALRLWRDRAVQVTFPLTT